VNVVFNLLSPKYIYLVTCSKPLLTIFSSVRKIAKSDYQLRHVRPQGTRLALEGFS